MENEAEEETAKELNDYFGQDQTQGIRYEEITIKGIEDTPGNELSIKKIKA